MKKRTLAGGAVVGAVLFLVLNGWIPGLSPSNGDGPQGDKTDVGEENPLGSLASETKDAKDKQERPKKPTKPEPQPETKTVELLVHEKGVGIGYTDKQYHSGSIEEAVKLAKNAVGDKDGVKVRIMKDISGKLSTLSRLEEELLKAGIKSDEIYSPRNLLDLNGEKEKNEKASE